MIKTGLYYPRWYIAVAAFLLTLGHSAHAAFVHPGGLHNQADLDRMKTHVLAGDHPWVDGWNQLVADTGTLLTYSPHATANMGNSRQNASADAHAAYNAIIRWYISGNTAYADKAVQICNAWSAVVNTVPSGTDIPGLSGIPIFEFGMVGELLRIYPGWAPSDFDRFKTMMTTWWYPVCHDFLTRHNNACVTHYWTNWDACNTGALIAMGVLCDNQAIYDEGVQYFQNGAGAGSMLNAVAVVHPNGLGQWQESGRDQEHAQLGVGLLAAACEVAWKQGLDLYGYMSNRLLAGAEYVARTNLSEPVPYTTYNNCDNVNQYFVSINGMGRIDDRPVWELIYNHYVVRKGGTAPNVQKMAQLMRPEHGSIDHFGYGTLTFTLDATASPYPASPAPPAVTGLVATAGVGRVMLQWDPSAGDTAQGYKVLRATTSGGPYTSVASWTNNTYPQYSDTAVTNGTQYYYVVAANNQSGTGTNSSEASATPLAAGGLPDGWARQDVGTLSTAGAATYANVSNNTFIVSGTGSGIGGTADALSYAYVTMSGDATITTRLLLNGSNKVGIMMRESLDSNAAAASLTLGDTGLREAFFGSRSSTGATMSFQQGNDYTNTPTWFRLQRAGNSFTASQSADGVTWFVVGSPRTVTMNSIFRVGLAVCGNTATFDNVSLVGTTLAGPPANLLAVSGNGQVSLAWNAASGATSYTLRRGTSSGGPYTVLAAGLTSTSYLDTGLTNGTNYYYVVSALQNTFETANSNEAAALVGDIVYTWNATPTSGNWSAGANWVGGITPSAGASLSFGASTTTTLSNDITALVLNRISYTSTAPTLTIGGNALSLAGDLSNGSAATEILNLPINLQGMRTINASGGAITLGGVIADGTAGSGIVKSGTKTLTLTAQNTFTGPVIVNAGTLTIAGTGTGTAGSPTTGALGRGTVQLAGATLTSSAAALVFNNIVVASGTTSSITSPSANITLAGNISGSGNIAETGANTGGTHLNGDNSGFTGTFTSTGNGNHRMRFNSPNAGSANATWVLSNNNTDGYGFTGFGSSGTISFGALSGGGNFRSDNGNNTTVNLSIGALNTDTTFSGTIVVNGTQALAVTKVGTGTLIFTGANTYIGSTTVTAGTLLMNNTGTNFNSPVTVTGGAFGGIGTTKAAVTVGTGAGDGALLTPGNLSIGTFTTTAGLTLNGDATYVAEVNSTTVTADKVKAASVTLTGAGLNVVELGTGSLALGTKLLLVDNTGAGPIVGTFESLPEGSTLTVGANTFRISYVGGTGNDVELTAVGIATVTLDALAPTYDGTAKAATVTTAPTGLAVSVTYAGNATIPINAGNYTVVATVTDPNYVGSATGTLAIAKAAATVTLSNLTPTYDGTAKAATVTTVPIGLAASVTYAGNATVPINAGSYAVVATVTDPNYVGSATGTEVIGKATASVVLSNLTQTYDGTARVAGATTSPIGRTVNITYNGSSTPPTNAGSYAIVANVNDPNYVGSATGTLVVAKAPATIALGGLTAAYDGAGHGATAATSPVGLNVVITYNGATTLPTDVGTYAVTATINEPNYQGSATGTFAIGRAFAGLTLNGLSRTYDGTPQVVTVTTSPAGLSTTTVQYNGSPTAPTSAGSYAVSVAVLDPNYQGAANATLVIAKANQTLTVPVLGTLSLGLPVTVTATSSSGLPVTLSIVAGSGSLSGTTLTPTAAGTMTLRATQAGNSNYNAATLDVFVDVTDKLSQSITFAGIAAHKSTDAAFPLSATASSGLPVTFSVVSGPAMVNGSTLTLTGTGGTVVVRASQGGNATYSAAPSVDQSFQVTLAGTDTFFGDLVPDGTSNESIGGFRILAASTKAGDIAAAIVADTLQGNVILVAPSLNLNVSVPITINADGTYSATFTSGTQSLTMTGTLANGILTGRIAALHVSFSTPAQVRTGTTVVYAGYYAATALNAAQGATYSIVGPNGQALVLAVTPSLTTGGVATVSGAGAYSLTPASGVTISGTIDASAAAATTAVVVNGQTTNFSGLKNQVVRTDRLVNLSSRGRVNGSSSIVITGFVIGGTEAKQVLIRAIGPGLAAYGVTSVLPTPRLRLYQNGQVIAENSGWSTAANAADIAAAMSRVGAFPLTVGSGDSAILMTLQPGTYSAHVSDGNQTGVVMAEIYDSSINAQGEYQRLVNISTSGEVGTGENVLIGGFVVTGNSPKKVLIRGIGPTLAQYGVNGVLVDPKLTLYRNGEVLAQNDNWGTGEASVAADIAAANARTGAFTLPAGSKDAVLILTLAPGGYTAQVSGVNSTTGAAMVEMYEVPEN